MDNLILVKLAQELGTALVNKIIIESQLEEWKATNLILEKENLELTDKVSKLQDKLLDKAADANN